LCGLTYQLTGAPSAPANNPATGLPAARPLERRVGPQLLPSTQFFSLEDGLEIFELVEEVPDVAICSVHAVRMQIGKAWIIVVAIEGVL
jgi:hypothetical protein